MSNRKHDSHIITIPNAKNLGVHLVLVKDNQIHINVSYEEISLELMDFSIRSINALKAQGINSLEKLLEYTVFDLMHGKYMTRGAIKEIQDVLEENQLTLKKRFQDNIIPDETEIHEIFVSQHGFQKTIHQLKELCITTVGSLKNLTAKANNEVISDEMVSRFESKLKELALM